MLISLLIFFESDNLSFSKNVRNCTYNLPLQISAVLKMTNLGVKIMNASNYNSDAMAEWIVLIPVMN